MTELSGERDPSPSASASTRRRWSTLVSAAVLALAGALVAACGESSPQGPAPAPGGPASVAVTATIEAAGGGPASQQSGSGGLGSAFDAADVAAVRVTGPGGSALADREVAFDPGSGGAELSLELTIEDDRVPATVELALRRGADRLFEGATGLTLVAGETATAELSLSAVPAAVSVPAGPVTFTALGDSAELEAAVVFATGDTIPGLSPTWSSSDAAVVDVSEDGTLVADAPGTAEAVAAHEGLSASVAVEVDPEVATVAVEPDAATFTSLSGTEAFSVQVTDANGNALTDEPVTWSSTDVQVAAVDGSGLTTARGDGAALVVAEAMGTADTASVTVDLGPTGRVAGQVGRVQPPASSSSTAASASASTAAGDGGVGAAITTNPAGGVEVRFLQGGAVVSRTFTDSEGNWTSPAIPPGTYTLEYASADLETVRHPDVVIEEGTTGSVADVPMVPASDQPGTVAGTAVNSRTGSGVSGAAVELRAGFDDPDGEVVASATAGADGGYEITGVEPGTYTITGTAPDFAPDEITGVALGGETFGGQDLTLVPPPEVTISSPAEGATFSSSDPIPFEGSADDPEQGTLTGDALVWSSDQLADPVGTGASFTAALPAGEHTITLTATNDRGASGEASVGITVEQQPQNEPPSVTIIRPEDGTTIVEGEFLNLDGSATDPEDGDLFGEDLVWESDIDGQIGTGVEAFTSNLSVGTHTITLTATDSEGKTGEASVSVTVQPPPAFVYATNQSSDDVSKVAAGSNRELTRIPVGASPAGIDATPDGSRLYVANSFDDNIGVIDVSTGQVTTTISTGAAPVDVAITPDGSRAYVPNLNDNNVSVIDLATNQVTATVMVGSEPGAVAITPDGSRALVTNEFSNSVSVIDVSTNTVTATHTVAGGPDDLAITPGGSVAYVVQSNDNSVAVLDIGAGAVTNSIGVGDTPTGVGVTPDGSQVFVANEFSGDVTVVDAATNTVTTTIAAGTFPKDVVFGPGGDTAYVPAVGSDGLVVIDVPTLQNADFVSTNDAPTAAAVVDNQ